MKYETKGFQKTTLLTLLKCLLLLSEFLKVLKIPTRRHSKYVHVPEELATCVSTYYYTHFSRIDVKYQVLLS